MLSSDSTIPEFRSIGKEIENFAMGLCPLVHKMLFLMFFGLLLGMGHYCLLLVASKDMGNLEKAVWFCGGVWCLFNIVFNYMMTVLVSPGTPSDIPAIILAPITHRCRRCGITKPPRTHHCSICNRCVLQMDRKDVAILDHCPWVGTCVGHHNRQYFINFLTYTTLGLAEMLRFVSLQDMPMVFVLVLTLLVCLGLFSGYHWLIVLRGRTSLEVCWDDPRYQPSTSFSTNLSIVFGTSNIFLCLMPNVTILKNHGNQWEIV